MNSLVTCGWLHNLLRGSATKMKVLEASWAARGVGEESFLEQHIPSAHFFDMWRCCTPTQERPRALHNPECFEEYSQQLGINNDSHIVIYDKGPVYFAARLWFQFKAYGHENVSVVDGGMIKWLQENLPVESGEAPTPEAGSFKVDTSLLKKYFKTFEEVSEKGFAETRQLVDTRHTEHFSGSLPEPSQATVAALLSADMSLPTQPQSGHIPGAKNLYHESLLDPSNRSLLPRELIATMLKDKGIDLEKPVTTHCYNGIAACLIPLALSQLGKHTDVSVYQGSWTEYSQRATSDMVSKTEGHNGNAAGGG